MNQSVGVHVRACTVMEIGIFAGVTTPNPLNRPRKFNLGDYHVRSNFPHAKSQNDRHVGGIVLYV